MSTEQQAVEAALLFDLPALRRAGDGGRAFAQALSSTPEIPEQDASSPDLLARAGAAIAAERRGDTQLARELLRALDGQHEWATLLAASLRAWAPSMRDEAAIDEVLRAARACSLSARAESWMHCRLMVISYDLGLKTRFAHHLDAALSVASGQLGMVLRAEEWNRLGRPVVADLVGGRMSDHEEDELILRSWIDAEALAGAQEFEAKGLKEAVSGPWSQTFQMGRRPIDRIAAADLQATWAGALWQRGAIRRQLGATALRMQPQSSSDAAWGLWMWLDGGGDEIQRLGEKLEPVLTTADIDAVVESWRQRVQSESARLSGLARLALTFWDRCSIELVKQVMDEMPTAAGDHPVLELTRRAFARLGRRAPERLQQRAAELDSADVSALLDEMGPRQVAALSASAKASLLTGVNTDTDLDLLPALGLGPPDLEAPSVSPFRAAEVMGTFPESVSDNIARGTVEALSQTLASISADAMRGRFGIGYNVAGALGVALAHGPVPTRALNQGRAALIDLAGDVLVSGDVRRQALSALANVAHTRGLPESDLQQIRRFEPPQHDSFPLGLELDVFEASRLLILAASPLSESELGRLVALSRSLNDAARIVALNAAGLALQGDRAASAVSWILLSGLFDPVEEVAAQAISGLQPSMVTDPNLSEALLDRLGKLQQTRGRRTRVAIAGLVRRWLPSQESRVRAALASLEARAGGDPSWQVREQVRAEEDPR